VTPDEVARMFASRIAAVRIPFDPVARTLLAALVDEATLRMAAPDAAGRMDELRVNVDALLADLVQQCRILRFDTIPPLALISALERLCPLWPFCEATGTS
jgi:hypothetical protein